MQYVIKQMENEMDGLIKPDSVLVNDWDFPVETVDLTASKLDDCNLYTVPPSMARGIMRTDTNQMLGVHGSKYKAIKHDTVVNSVFDALSSANISKDFTHNIEVFDNGAKMRGTINFPDLVIEPELNDHISFQVVFYNSYDGSWSFAQQAQGLRLWCLNGCTTPDTVAKTVAKHTTHVNVEASAAKIQLGLDAFFNSKDKYQQWMGMPVTSPVAEGFFKTTICDVKNNTSEQKYNFKRLDALMAGWKHNSAYVGPNKWALYNTMTEWATHTDESRSPANTRRLRENQIASAIKQLTFV
jgi:hypothetical protein